MSLKSQVVPQTDPPTDEQYKVENSEKVPCYDCGSTIKGHHTTICEMAWPGDVKDLPCQPGTQYWADR